MCDQWADREPDRVAIIHDNGEAVEHLSYGQLRAQSNQLMALLANLGIRANDRVGIDTFCVPMEAVRMSWTCAVNCPGSAVTVLPGIPALKTLR